MNRLDSPLATGFGRLAAAGVLAVLFAGVSATSVSASHDDDPLVGTWAVQVTRVECASGAPLAPPFHSLVTFHEGGTLSESAGPPGFAAGQRTNALGTWTRHGRYYVQRMIALINFTTEPNLPPPAPGPFDPSKPVTPGFNAGWQTVTHKVRLTSRNRLVSSGGNEFYDQAGNLYRSGCSTAAGERFR